MVQVRTRHAIEPTQVFADHLELLTAELQKIEEQFKVLFALCVCVVLLSYALLIVLLSCAGGVREEEQPRRRGLHDVNELS